MHPNSVAVFVKHALPLVRPGWSCLEISPDKAWFIKHAIDAHGLKIHYWTADLWCQTSGDKIAMPDEYSIDCPDELFNAVWAANVIEHVGQPWRWVAELARVTRPGGIVALVCPRTWEDHRVKVGRRGHRDAWRVLPDGMKELFAAAGLKTVLALTDTVDPGTPREQRRNRGPTQDTIGIGKKL